MPVLPPSSPKDRGCSSHTLARGAVHIQVLHIQVLHRRTQLNTALTRTPGTRARAARTLGTRPAQLAAAKARVVEVGDAASDMSAATGDAGSIHA